MDRKLSFSLLFIFTVIFSSVHAQLVTNVKAKMEGQKFAITYNLAPSEKGQPINIELFVSEDAGQVWQGPLKAVSGDVGKNSKAGDDKKIYWDFSAEPGTHSIIASKIKFDVKADTAVAHNVTDLDGNVYNTVRIGAQVWLKENLKTTKLNDGTSIPNVPDTAQWCKLSTPGYCWYNNDIGFKATYGALYNWHTVNTGKLCPSGWHVPSDEEWGTLVDFMGGQKIAGGMLKEAGTAHWQIPNTSAENRYDFYGLPGGNRKQNGEISLLGIYGFFWSATQVDTKTAWGQCLDDYNPQLFRGNSSKNDGFSVRCVKNE
jgi:uncharacterized protein (TIGR02145 family)